MSADARHESSAIDRLLRVALSAGIEAAVRAHIQRGGNIQGRDEKGWTALMIAASRDRAAICNILLDAGVAVGAVDGAGRDALSIAREFNALAAAEVIARRATNPANGGGSRPVEGTSALPLQPATAGPGNTPNEPHQHHDSRLDIGAGIDHSANSERLELTFGDWEPLKESAPPPELPHLAEAARARQQRIDQHLPVDTAAEWNEFEAYLPESARPLPRGDDDENRALLRRLLLRALREGSIPRLAVEDAMSARGDGEQRDDVAEAALAATIAAFGAELDEREEQSSSLPGEDFEVFVDPVERDGEESAVEEALDYFDDLRFGRNEPLRLYFRSATKPQLLTAEQEVELARAMERAVERALDALANWPWGLMSLTCAASAAGSRLGSIVQCGEAAMNDEAAENPSGESDDGNHGEGGDPFGVGGDEEAEAASVPEPEEPTGPDAPAVVFARLSLLVQKPSAEYREIRSELALLRFRRPYLLSLLDAARRDEHGAARDYVRAMGALLVVRDRMVSANLRLVMDLARRRLYLGIPLEDLIQEGNIGLVKAVDRFDWRRGFRFSTMATWWIKQQMGRGASDSALEIRLPTHAYERMSKARRDIETFERQQGGAASLAQQVEIAGLDLRRFELIARAFSVPMSIEGAEAAGCFDVEPADLAFDATATKEVNALVEQLLAPLRRKDKEIIRQRYGIGVPEDRTLEEVGTAFDLTRERIRQIEAKVIKKFKHRDTMERLSLALGRCESEGDMPSFQHAGVPVDRVELAPALVPPIGIGVSATRDYSDGAAEEWCEDPDSVENAGPGPAKGQP